MCLQRNNKGMTLLELIISMAISAIVISIIILIINSASHGFHRTSDEVNLQLEAQTAVNQLTDLAMEAGKIEESVSKPASEDKKYILSGSEKSYAVLFVKSDHKLYLIEAEDPSAADAVTYSAASDFEKKYLMAEYVDHFEIRGLLTHKVTIDISFALGEDSYSQSEEVRLRNAN